VARSKSCIIASSMAEDLSRSSFAAATMSSLEMGLRFWGMVELAPVPLEKPSHLVRRPSSR
jgi:hypothetical protein